MKIALLGYGKMGRTIEKTAEERGHQIVYKTSSPPEIDSLKKAEVAIDFSIPDAAFDNITTCFKNHIPAVCGTTGWLDNYDKASKICKENNSGFIYASNFSLGVNLFFELNEHLAKMMEKFQTEYSVSLEEIHHTEKLDKPSGTAKTLAEQILPYSEKADWFLRENKEERNNEISVEAKRIEDVHGTHRVMYSSEIDELEIKHTAFSRKGFALGAVLAAEFLKDKQGVFTMKDVLGI
jgi:4-hydroxy-tetrahydrodipicolinate reductase